MLGKDPMGQLAWMEEYWQRPVLGLVDYADLPNSPTHGDRYVIVSSGTTAIDSTAIDPTAIGSTAIDSTALNSSAIDVTILPDELQWNDIVQYFNTDKDGNAVEQWIGISPKKGYRLHDSMSNAMYYFDGFNWQKDRVESGGQAAVAQEYLTRQQLLDLKALNKLEPGIRYYITDRDVILTATTGSELSIEGDHTRALSAYSYIDLYDHWASGNITSVTANGAELLPSPVAFDVDIAESLINLSDIINDHLDFVGYWALDAGSRLLMLRSPDAGRGALDLTVSVNGSTLTGQQFFQGHNVGELWFKVKYDVVNDHFSEMSDSSGNIVRYDLNKPMIGDIDPIDAFPWGHSNVTNNVVNNGVFFAYTATGVIANNLVDFGLFRADGYNGPGIEHNKLVYGSQLQAMLAEGIVVMNTIELWSALMMSGTVANVGVNQIFNGFINATGSDLKGIGLNTIRDTQLNLENYGDYNDINYNCFMACDLVNLNGAKGHIRYSQFKKSSVNGVGGDMHLEHVCIEESELTYTNSSAGSEFRNVNISKQSAVDMSNGRLRLIKCTVENSTIHAQNADVSMGSNDIKANSELLLTGATINTFNYNDINNTSWTLINANTAIERNKISYSTINAFNYTGAYFKENRMEVSSVELVDSTNEIYGNDFYKSELICSNASGNIIHNKVNYSVVKANHFSGVKLIHCEVFGLSEINIESGTADYGAIRVTDKTVLNASGTISPIYDLDLKLTEVTIIINETIIGKTIRRSFSNREYILDLSYTGGVLDFSKNEAMFSGVIVSNVSGTLNTIYNCSFTPEQFILKPSNFSLLILDSSTATNITLPNGVSTITLDGSNGDYAEIRFNNDLSSCFVHSIHTF